MNGSLLYNSLEREDESHFRTTRSYAIVGFRTWRTAQRHRRPHLRGVGSLHPSGAGQHPAYLHQCWHDATVTDRCIRQRHLHLQADCSQSASEAGTGGSLSQAAPADWAVFRKRDLPLCPRTWVCPVCPLFCESFFGLACPARCDAAII